MHLVRLLIVVAFDISLEAETCKVRKPPNRAILT